jgi:hypothetical protein
MRPIFSLWSDCRPPARKYRLSTAVRGTRPSISRKIFLTAVIVIAAGIGIRGLFGQATDGRALPNAAGAHLQNPAPPSTNATGRRTAGVAAIPLSPQPMLPVDQAAIGTTPSPTAAGAELSHPTAPAMGVGASADHQMPPALIAIPGVLAKASALPPPSTALTAVNCR